MTDHHDDEFELGRSLKAQETLYNATLRSDVTVVATDWLARAYLLSEIAGEDIEAAVTVIDEPAGRAAARTEYDSLTEADRKAVLSLVGLHWSVCVKRAIEKLWHVCGKLQIDPTNIDEDHVALHAATLLSDPDLVPSRLDEEGE